MRVFAFASWYQYRARIIWRKIPSRDRLRSLFRAAFGQARAPCFDLNLREAHVAIDPHNRNRIGRTFPRVRVIS